MDHLAAELLFGHFVTLLQTAVETAISKVHKFLWTNGDHLLNTVVLAVSSVFAGCSAARMSYSLTLALEPPSFPVHNMPYSLCEHKSPRKNERSCR